MNQDRPDGREVCVHAFIGKLADGSIAAQQTLPWNMRGWHCGGSGNDTHIGFEICEDGLNDVSYFAAVHREAAELCAYLCKEYGLTLEENVICHSEGYKLGIALQPQRRHAWFPRFGSPWTRSAPMGGGYLKLLAAPRPDMGKRATPPGNCPKSAFRQRGKVSGELCP